MPSLVRSPGPPRATWVLRALCHLAAEVPFLAVVIAEITRVWRPYGDDAVVAWRSYDVFSSHSPLVGQFTQSFVSAHPPYDLGPAEYWLLALPVRLDTVHGALWGAALVCVLAIGLAIEAAWSVARFPGAAAISLAVVVLVGTYSAVALDPIWNPYFGAVFLLATLATGWATATGNLRWFPALVVTASISAQSHLVFAIPAVAVAVGASLLGVATIGRRRAVAAGRWVVGGLLAGVALWVVPFIEQLTGHPGNISVLLANTGQSRVGISTGLRAIWTFARPLPEWWHSAAVPATSSVASTNHFVATLATGSAVDGVAVLVALAVIAVLAAIAGRRLLCAAATVSVLVALSTAWSIGQLPAPQISRLSYLDVVLWPVGMIVWATFLFAALTVVVAVARRIVAGQTTLGARSALALPYGIAMAGLLAAGVLGTTTDISATASNPYRLEALHLTAALTPLAEKVAPPGPFTMTLDGQLPPALYPPSLIQSIAYRLHVEGLDPRFAVDWQQIGPWTIPVPRSPTVTLRVGRGGQLSVTSCRADGRNCRTAGPVQLRPATTASTSRGAGLRLS